MAYRHCSGTLSQPSLASSQTQWFPSSSSTASGRATSWTGIPPLEIAAIATHYSFSIQGFRYRHCHANNHLHSSNLCQPCAKQWPLTVAAFLNPEAWTPVTCHLVPNLSTIGRLRKNGEITVRADGPYGDSGERPAWIKHPVLVIFAGGIGVSHMAILESVLGVHNTSMETMLACMPVHIVMT